MNRLDGIVRAMGGSDVKHEQALREAAAAIPQFVLLQLDDRDIADLLHTVGSALREAWLSGQRAGDNHE